MEDSRNGHNSKRDSSRRRRVDRPVKLRTKPHPAQPELLDQPDKIGAGQAAANKFLHEFLVRAAVGGLAIQHRRTEVSVEERQSYRLQILLFQWSFSDHRLMTRARMRGEDSLLRRCERLKPSVREILPEICSHSEEARGRRLTSDALLTLGQVFAAETGMAAGVVQAQIDAGLLAAARMTTDGIALTSDQSGDGLRRALFGWRS